MGMEINVLTQVLSLKHGLTLYLHLVLAVSLLQLPCTTRLNLYLPFSWSPHPLQYFSYVVVSDSSVTEL